METSELNDKIKQITANIDIDAVDKMRINHAIYNLATEFYLSRCNQVVDEVIGRKTKG